MQMVTVSALKTLPPLYSQDTKDDPIIYVKLASADESWVGYLTEGAHVGEDFVVFGLFVGAGRTWGQLSVKKLEEGLHNAGISAHEEASFHPAPLSRVAGFRRTRRTRLDA